MRTLAALAVVVLLAAPAVAADVPGDGLPAAVLGTAPAPRGERVAYFPDDPAARGYLAVPKTPGKHGGVVLIHEWNGLDVRVQQVADALADEGYVVLAADLYSGRMGTTREENMALVQETLAKPERLVANLDAAAAFLRKRDDVTGKIGAVGWCYGGGVALSWALGGERHEATAIFYGSLLDDPEKLKTIHHEVYGTFGQEDTHPSPAEVERFVAALRKAGVPNDVHIYDDVGHGFWLWVDKDPATRTKPALDAWQRLKAYLGRTIGAK